MEFFQKVHYLCSITNENKMNWNNNCWKKINKDRPLIVSRWEQLVSHFVNPTISNVVRVLIMIRT
jgi:hypothetical protein